MAGIHVLHGLQSLPPAVSGHRNTQMAQRQDEALHHDNGSGTSDRAILNDFCIQASSVRLPFLAAGLVNSALAVLLSQLSAQFFEMAILEPISNAKQDTTPKEGTTTVENNALDTLTTIQPTSSTVEQAIDISTQVQPDKVQPTITTDMSVFRIKEEADMDLASFLLPEGGINAVVPQNGQTIPAYNFQAINEAPMTAQTSTSRVLSVDYLKRYPCNYRGCGKVFFSRSSLFYHKQAHVVDKPHVCTYAGCGLSFSTDALLRSHLKLHEAKLSNIQFPCSHPGCGKMFINHDRLAEHIRIHTGERPYICDYPGCTHRFARRGNLFAHKRVHLDKTQRRQYHCIHPGCGKTFLYARSLTEHMNLHMGERPYACDFPNCDKRFTSKSYLYAHRRTHIGSDGQAQCSQDSCNTYTMSPIPVTVSNPVIPNPRISLNPFSQVSQPSSFPLHYHHAFYPDSAI